MFILTAEMVEQLKTYVHEQIDELGCDVTLRHTLVWADRNGIDRKALVEVVQSHGGYCDCEILYNLRDHVGLGKGRRILLP